MPYPAGHRAAVRKRIIDSARSFIQFDTALNASLSIKSWPAQA